MADPTSVTSHGERFVAALTPVARNDLRALVFSPVKQVLRRLLVDGADLSDLMKEGADIEVLPDRQGGWSWLRVGPYVAVYRRLTEAERKDVGRNTDILVARIIPLSPGLVLSTGEPSPGTEDE